MNGKTYAVVGATGHVGSVVAEELKAQGRNVRLVSRRSGVSIDDIGALTDAFSGTDGVFLMIPAETNAPDLRARQNEIGGKLVDALKKAHAKRVVFLSSLNAQYETGTGPVLGLHDMENRLNALDIDEVIHLRPAYFMENHLWGLGLVRQAGFYGTSFKSDAALPMIASRDIGKMAANLLIDRPSRHIQIRELLGPRNYTMEEATHILGVAIGKPDLKYIQFSYEDARKAMLNLGMSASYADAAAEISRSFNEEKVKGTEERSARNTTTTTLDCFAAEVYRPAYESFSDNIS
ncbi:NmrA family NAD(P)-binding protein [Sideroxydans sp. CL21]|uniref:NmrA family NAD(P)-binding protein n=1 Tax=Sideroxydans sp. CL21 TaxID=2600596 RepID=UPI0012AA52AE|nr:NmrA family NAD(P)-binding protein [Sideroxydans sp. CL21]VVC85252.1 hypothetical protein [Sideroxydans sp. CL21]